MRETSGGVVAKPDRVIVIGAGIIGASCAYHLAARGQHVTVLEKFDAPAEGSTGRSFASVRAQWSDDLNVTISWESIQTYRDFEKLHNVAGLQKTGELAGKVLSKGGHAIKCRPMSWERIKNRDFEIKDRETFLKFIRTTQDLVNMDVDKAKVMKDQLERFNLGPTKRPDLKTEAGVIAWILKNNMDVKTIRKSLKDIQKSSELV